MLSTALLLAGLPVLLAALVLNGVHPTNAAAQTAPEQPALSFDSLGSGADYYQGGYSLGWRFTANQTLQVTALGFYDDGKNGIFGSHDVGIFRVSDCALMTSAVVTNEDPLEGFFRFRPIQPTTLPGDADYYIAAVNGSDKYAINVTDILVDPAITFWGFAIYGSTQPSDQLNCPNGASQQGFHGDFGPSFKIVSSSTPVTPTPTATPTITPTPSPTPVVVRGTSTAVNCNRGPNPADDYVCTATVGAKDAQGPNPSGTVSWSLPTNRGSFRYGSSCTLEKSVSGNTSFCSVVYIQPIPRIVLGTTVPVVAAYSGDSYYSPSSSPSDILPGANLIPLPPQTSICLLPNPQDCGGLNAEVPDSASRSGLGSILVSYYGAFGTSAAESRRLPSLRPPSRKGSVSFRIRYSVFRSDNPQLAQIAALPKAPRSVRGSSIYLGAASGGLRFGESRDVRISMTSPGRTMLQLAGPAKVDHLNVRVAVEAIRQGDRRQSVLVQTIPVTIH